MFDMYSLAVTMWGIAIPLAVAGTYFLNWRWLWYMRAPAWMRLEDTVDTHPF